MSAEANAYHQAVQRITCEGCTLRKLPESFWQQSEFEPAELSEVLNNALLAYGQGREYTWDEEEPLRLGALAATVGDFSRNVTPIPEFEETESPGELLGNDANELIFRVVTSFDGDGLTVADTPLASMQPESQQVVACLGKVLSGKCGVKARLAQPGQHTAAEMAIGFDALGDDLSLGAAVLETYARNAAASDLWKVVEELLPGIEALLVTRADLMGQPCVLPNLTPESDPGDMRQLLFTVAEHLRASE
ncbi:MAG TPA: hypothetical protein VJR27_05655 [Candidatus Saccharimonadales bacterium]|nr:hypothetical protein [Candidatus Saccharimonadales bacterium]